MTEQEMTDAWNALSRIERTAIMDTLHAMCESMARPRACSRGGCIRACHEMERMMLDEAGCDPAVAKAIRIVRQECLDGCAALHPDP
jgi:hypothetical protein